MLGGMFDSRLNLNLREAKHWAYGASSSLQQAHGPQIFLDASNVERSHTAEGLREMRRELDEVVGTRPPGSAETEAAKQSDVRSLPGDFESLDGVSAAFRHLIEYGLPDDYWNAYVPRVEALGMADLRSAAAKMVKPDQLTWVVVGDLEKIEAPLRSLNLGEVKVLDTDGKTLR
jgi:zinc protease